MDVQRAMALFVAIAENKSISAAGQTLGLTAPTATRVLSDFEDWCGNKLVLRTTRQIELTPAGAQLLPHCQEIVDSTLDFKRAAQQLQDEPGGTIRVTVARPLAARYIAPVIASFMEQYPNVTIDVNVANGRVDILRERFDMAVFVGELKDSSLSARRLSSFKPTLVAAPAFLDRHRLPQHPDDLLTLPCIVDTVPQFGAKWPMLQGKSVNARCFVDDGDTTLQLALQGQGIAYLPSFMVHKELLAGTLQEVLADFTQVRLGIYAVFPPKPYVLPAARFLCDFLAKHLKEEQLP